MGNADKIPPDGGSPQSGPTGADNGKAKALPEVPKRAFFSKVLLTQEQRYVYQCPTCSEDVEEEDIEGHACQPRRLMTTEEALKHHEERERRACKGLQPRT
jgi:DNA-directed RNA polymerase subunit RPC12/RpoP